MGMPDPFTVTMDATDAVHVCRRIRALDRERWPVAVAHMIPDAASARAFIMAWLGDHEGQRLVDAVGAATAVDLARGLALAVVSELV